ncbi:MAG: hypothetical protein NC548_33615 [Lachnospiraceae bacterium]|nr:hypothetical protein [Lachnospiraceae bacterium]MCM1232723.1 hypothetical protein [Ruminococcus flavefaciens]
MKKEYALIETKYTYKKNVCYYANEYELLNFDNYKSALNALRDRYYQSSNNNDNKCVYSIIVYLYDEDKDIYTHFCTVAEKVAEYHLLLNDKIIRCYDNEDELTKDYNDITYILDNVTDNIESVNYYNLQFFKENIQVDYECVQLYNFYEENWIDL